MVFQFIAEYIRCNAIAAETSVKHLQRFRSWNNLPKELAVAIGITLWLFAVSLDHGRMIRVKTINKINLMIVLTKQAAQI